MQLPGHGELPASPWEYTQRRAVVTSSLLTHWHRDVWPNCWLHPAQFQFRLLPQLLGLTQKLVLHGQKSLNRNFSSASITLMDPGAGMHFQWENLSSTVWWTTLHIHSHRLWPLLVLKLHRKSNTWITSKQSCSLLMQTTLKAKAKQHLAARPLPLRHLSANLKMISGVLNWLLCLSFFPVH